MKLSDYQKKAIETDNIVWTNEFSADIPLLGFVGELGSVASVLKKWQRDGIAYEHFEEDLKEEMGDVLWYVAIVSHHLGLDLCFQGDTNSNSGSHIDRDKPYTELYELYMKVPKLISIKNQITSEAKVSYGSNQSLINEILVHLHNIAEYFDTNLETIANDNHSKTHDYWIGDFTLPAMTFDKSCPDYERLPRVCEVDIIKCDDNKSLMQISGVNIGDKLTDNSHLDDGYRFHDVFHLANVATLGWSPVFRRMIKRKRKSIPKIDETEDGARASIVEELVVNQIYAYARLNNFYVSNDLVDHSLIKSISLLVEGLEVHECKLWEWKHCIIEGCRAFAKLRDAEYGKLIIDSNNRTLKFIKC